MIKKKNSKFFFLFKIFLLLSSSSASSDILEKYLKKDGEKQGPIHIKPERVALPNKAKAQEQEGQEPAIPMESSINPTPVAEPYPIHTKKKHHQIARQRSSSQFNFTFGATRNHLVNQVYFNYAPTYSRKFSPLLGLKLEHNDKSKSFSNLAFSIGASYVLLRYHDFQITTRLEQELENYFSIPEQEKVYSILTTRAGFELSYDIGEHFRLFAAFTPKISYASDDYLADAPKGLREEVRQILDFQYGFLVK